MFKWGSKVLYFWRSQILLDALNNILEARLDYWREQYLPLFDALNASAEKFSKVIGAHKRYMRTSHLEHLMNAFSFDLPVLDEAAWGDLGFNLDSKIRNFISYVSNPVSFQKSFNNAWADSELDNNRQLFDQLEAHPLTESQRRSCVVDEDNILVLAGAGTGKTSTMVAKAKYLVANGYAEPHEILMLAYGNDAQAELRDRVNQHAELAAVQVSTFHSTGKSIINFHEKNTVSRLATDEKTYIKFVETQIQEMLKDKVVGKDFNQFATCYLYPRPNDLAFKSQGQYLRYVKDNELRALSGDLVKSFEELTIANYLFSQGIKFVYEKPYPYSSPEPGRGGYQPDFYLPDLDVYLEHFGIDKNGNTRSGIDAKKYNEEMVWKKNFHAENNTVLWETFSWQSHCTGGLTQVLENKIKDYCHVNEINEEDIFKTMTPSGIYARLKELGLVSGFSKLMASFLSLFKASPLGLEAIRVGNLDEYNFTRWELFKKIFLWLYNRYQSVLTANQTIDFADMINKATVYAEKPDFHERTKGRFKLKYLLVDEFQDISPIRASFIKALSAANPGCALMGVGDDWQAIYRFTGSDVHLTTEFGKHFGPGEVLQLDKTFRFNDRIEKVASGFVQKNPVQIPKQLVTHSKSYNPEVSIISERKAEAIAKAMNALGTLEPGSKPSVMFLSRFKKSLPDVRAISRSYPGYEFKAMSAHGSKGKQADYVIILDVIDDRWGFPSKVETDSILLVLLPGVDGFRYSEERRLFYVALSRAKKSVFIHTELGRESEFVKELMQYKSDVRLFLSDLTPAFVEHARCPECLEGNLVPLEGRNGLFYACSLGKHYCKTIVRACPKCQKAPIVPTGGYFECASGDCGYRAHQCPSCHNGMLIERDNVKDGSKFMGCSNFRGHEEGSCRYTKNLSIRPSSNIRRVES